MSGKKVFSFLSFFWFSAFLGRFIRPTSPFVTLPSSFLQFALAKQYPADLNGKGFITEMQNLPSVHKVNFEGAQFKTIGPVELINTVQSFREFQQVASVERSFSKLKLIKNFLSLNVELAMLSIARTIDFDNVIRNFAEKKPGKLLC